MRLIITYSQKQFFYQIKLKYLDFPKNLAFRKIYYYQKSGDVS